MIDYIKTHWKEIIGWILLWFLMTILVSTCHNEKQEPKVDIIEIHDTIIGYDTVIIDYPVLKEVKKIGKDTIKIETLKKDTILAEIEIEQKKYEDSNYTAYISGFEASLDSIKIYNRKEIINNYIEKRITETKQKHWGISTGFGMQYGLINKRFDIGPMVGISYTF